MDRRLLTDFHRLTMPAVVASRVVAFAAPVEERMPAIAVREPAHAR